MALRTLPQRYEGTAFIGVACSEQEPIECFSSINSIVRRPGDGEVYYAENTKGQETRTHLVNEFLASPHAWMLFLDGDMIIPPNALERLRCHGLPCVSGLYYRRVTDPMWPIWFENDPAYRWPMMPFRANPEAGRLYELGATGYGCWLIHREVFERLAPLLKGEPYIWEDDMDVWPYDLERVMQGNEQIVPLRGRNDRIGSDLRLSFFIRQAGYTIWGDPVVSCQHATLHFIGHREYNLQPEAMRELAIQDMTQAVDRQRRKGSK